MVAQPGYAPRPVALITGASSGIGLAFAEVYAGLGMDLVLVARKKGPLAAVAEHLEGQHHVSVTVLPGDLSDPDTPRQLFDQLAARGLRVDVLVNNAGFGVPGELCDVAWPRHRDTIEVMATAPVRLCHLFAPGMQARGAGRIINVSSLSALLPPHAGGTLYYPVKSFMAQFSLALRAELRAHGVHVTALCPGFTKTGFQATAGGTVETVRVPVWLWSSPQDVARAAIRAVEGNKPICIPGLFNRLVAVVFKLLPGGIARRLVGG